jgi:CBS domain-containing protein
MDQYAIRHIPVVEGERLVGMVTIDDVTRRTPLPAGLGF